MSEVAAYGIEHIRELRDIAWSRMLSVPKNFAMVELSVLQACYNGIGPDRWCPRFRRLTTWLLGFFEADALIHDYEYSLTDKSYSLFTLANLRFAYNAALLAFDRLSFRPAIKVALLGLLLALLCQTFGYSGYKTGSIPTMAPDDPERKGY